MKAFKLDNHVILRYHDLPGDEIPIIFIHGLGCASSFDYPQVASMGGLTNHRRILVDLVGSGYSDKPEFFDYTIANHAKYLKELLDHLSIDNIVIFGHSMGGAISIAFANCVKDKVKALILSEANLDSGGGFFSKKIASYSESDFVKFGYTEILQESVSSGNTEWAAGLSNSSPIAIHRNAVSLIKGQTPSWRQIFYSLDAAKTYIYGSKSLPDPDSEALTRNNINVAVVANAGHSMAWENPEELALVIKKSIL
ncbi:alpha/beta fold hydrolase [Vibrio gazogenes]|uniref:Pimeloyl-ACP methyl ester carboxylesterase n=1 Tax=Vibrio gazogenes DSM 21264 = NBRC 103151 TaxID=1123492 RepID=A0A1M5EYS4_VIBGA|nr:alpha/beta hydrolase [Vibrio gazogenes]USP14764.1 alpha/beta hydrolase [Vibrio gazogenes]SHF84415.1 Pimeloyl-ACP methyl ester carboxylesterase [Vibrio gazogenes DSM 21264] [Vibrio gazogenes DSM 21264 = NBRC 103151]SJN55132.1 Haloalkane dehalogenase [Vibrio gazogenes]